MKDNWFIPTAVHNVYSGFVKTHKNCSFTHASEEEFLTLPLGLTLEMKKDLAKHHSSVLSYILMKNIITLKETLIKGGKKELIEMGFDESAVTKVIKGKSKSHKGHIFKRVPK